MAEIAPGFCDFCSDLELATSAKGDGQLTAIKYDVLKMAPKESALATWTCQGPSKNMLCLDPEGGPGMLFKAQRLSTANYLGVQYSMPMFPVPNAQHALKCGA